MFQYRIAYGCWLNDSNQDPLADEDWPSVRIDANSLASLDKTIAFLEKAGYNYFYVFGLITNHNWDPNVASTISEERKNAVCQVIEIIHRHNLKLIYGLGVYSWGFDRIIAENPAVRGTSKQVMCASSSASEEIMYKVIDYIMTTFNIDGFHLEAADQGRCNCEACNRFISDIEYFNYINERVISYIRYRWPEKILLVNTSGYLAWGDTFTDKQLQHIIQLGNMVDVFIDVGSHGAFVHNRDRKQVISNIKASFGTSGGFWIYPPQRWNRLRWFIPHFKYNYTALRQLYEEGGRSCELFLSPLNNPGAEVTVLFNGLFLQNPSRDIEDLLTETIDILYESLGTVEREDIKALFLEAEDLFFDCWHPQRNRLLPEEYSDGVENLFTWSKSNSDNARPGEFFLEPLFGLGAGFPAYLSVHFTRDGRKKYKNGIEALLKKSMLLEKRTDSERVTRLVFCFKNILRDIELVNSIDI